MDVAKKTCVSMPCEIGEGVRKTRPCDCVASRRRRTGGVSALYSSTRFLMPSRAAIPTVSQHGTAAGAEGCHRERRAHGRQADRSCGSIIWSRRAKEFYNRWVKKTCTGAVRVLRSGGAAAAREIPDEVEASLDQRQVTDPITGENRPPDERLSALGRGKDSRFGLRQAVIPPGSRTQGRCGVQGRREVPARQPCAHA